jgi:hypothetical protein
MTIKEAQQKFIEKYDHLWMRDSNAESGIISVGVGIRDLNSKQEPLGICVGVYKSQALLNYLPDTFENFPVYKRLSTSLIKPL